MPEYSQAISVAAGSGGAFSCIETIGIKANYHQWPQSV
jgi:hypothetical protein